MLVGNDSSVIRMLIKYIRNVINLLGVNWIVSMQSSLLVLVGIFYLQSLDFHF